MQRLPLSERIWNWCFRILERWSGQIRFGIMDLQVGANCGLCGAWMPKEIVPAYWPWSMCEDCFGGGRDAHA